jgi:hypothetical protein
MKVRKDSDMWGISGTKVIKGVLKKVKELRQWHERIILAG